MFQVDDLIIYGSEGVCRVEAIGQPDSFDGLQEKDYYTLNPLYKHGKVYIPVDSTVFMRRIMSRQEVMDLIDRIPEIDDTIIENRNIRMLSDEYQNALKTHDCEEMIRVIKSIENKRGVMAEKGKKLGQVDEKFLKKASELLYGEFAAVLEISKEEVSEFLRSKIAGE